MIIAHDLGTTGNKASLHDETGRLLSAVTVSYPVDFRDGGIAEQNPRDWENAVIEATRTLLERTQTDRNRVTGMVLSGQMMGAVLLDEHYEPVRPAIIWADTRAHAQTAQLAERLGESEAYELLGHRVNPTYSLAKVMWVRDNEPDVFDRVRWFCVAKDFLVHRLTGRLVTEPSDASATNAFDLHAGTWSHEAIDAAGLDASIFPEVVPSTEVVGTLTDRVAAATGLNASTRVVMGGGDGPIAAVGAGVVAPEDGAYVCMGTSSWISFASATSALDPSRRTFTFTHVVPDMFVPTATMQAAGASVSWINEVLSETADGSTLARLVADADTDEAATGGLYFLPYLLGERSPRWDPDARGAFVGIGRHHGRPHLVRAVLEGVAFNLAIGIQAFRDAGVTIDRIDAVGGGAASDTWLQIMADVWGVTVRRRSVVEEANSLGAAVVGAVGLGLVDDFSAARDLSQVTAEFTPEPSRRGAYRDRLARFDEAYTALAPWFAVSGSGAS
ncbi:xylulokinase [Microcella alkaliphila]|uniref:Xylulose kinase n=1 Tax=Microcella alkaliphila TaxID=279828 RepID=A0A4Q7TGY4_9MICO|nr:xylulokinase [Microcella alkaliphila]RZT59533.1 xylulokinase [Microcella alkaliphila]